MHYMLLIACGRVSDLRECGPLYLSLCMRGRAPNPMNIAHYVYACAYASGHVPELCEYVHDVFVETLKVSAARGRVTRLFGTLEYEANSEMLMAKD